MATRKGRPRTRTGSTGRPLPDHFRTALLRNPTRRKIRELLERRPGMNKHQLAKALDMNHHTVEFHVGRMQESGLIETRPSSTNDREALCFTENNVHLWDDETTRILFGRGTPRRVAAYLAEHPGANVAEIAGALDIAATTIRRHLRLLQAAQLVQHIRIDRDVIYHAEPELADWLEVAGNLGLREGGRAEEG